MKKIKKTDRTLLEIGTEEIPAEYIEGSSQSLKDIGAQLLRENGIKYEEIRSVATPRRLTLLVEGISSKQEDRESWVSGPPKKVAYDEKDNPTQACKKFARAHGVKVKDLIVKNIKNGQYLCVRKVQKGLPTIKVLGEVFPRLIQSIKFPKNMSWPQSHIRFARPIRWICALFNDRVIKFSLGKITSDRCTRGHPSLYTRPIAIKDVGEYEKKLSSHYVIVDPIKRKNLIQKQISQKVKKLRGEILDEKGLIDEVNYLVEYPTSIAGSFGKEYLRLPREVLVNCIAHHQKFFSVVDAKSKSKLLPYFVAIKDGTSTNLREVTEGYERVLIARLADAEFFYRQDLKTSLQDKVERLKKVVFQEKLGSLYDKVKRVINLSEYIFDELIKTSPSTLRRPPQAEAPALHSVTADGSVTSGGRSSVARTALLSKADLVTEMVKEFPELEGVMGRIYALECGEDKEVAYGIEEHYLSFSNENRFPVTFEGIIVGIADKIDTLVNDYSIGFVPTGSEDPYGLRREAGGIVRVILGSGLRLNLSKLIDQGFMELERINSLKPENKERLKRDIQALFRQRIESDFSSKGYRYDEINATLDVGFDDILDAEARAKAVHKLRKLKDFEPVTIGFKRAKNILKQAEKFKIDQSYLRGAIQETLLKEEEEINLYQKQRDLKQVLVSLFQHQEYERALKELVGLREYIDKFFDKVLVMTEEISLRDNRLTLLKEVVDLFMKIADFSRIVVG